MYITHLDNGGNMEDKRSAVPTYEQETTISFNRDGDKVDVWTSDTTMMTKLDKKCEESPNDYKCIEVGKSIDGLLANKRYTINNKRLLSFRSGIGKRTMTDEQRAKAAERMRQVGKSNAKDNNNIAEN